MNTSDLGSEQRSCGICLRFHTWQNSPHGQDLKGQRGQKLNCLRIAFHREVLVEQNGYIEYVFMGSGLVPRNTEMLQTPDAWHQVIPSFIQSHNSAVILKHWLCVRHWQSTAHMSLHLMLSVTLRTSISLAFSDEKTEAWKCKINLPSGTQLVKWWN